MLDAPRCFEFLSPFDAHNREAIAARLHHHDHDEVHPCCNVHLRAHGCVTQQMADLRDVPRVRLSTARNNLPPAFWVCSHHHACALHEQEKMPPKPLHSRALQSVLDHRTSADQGQSSPNQGQLFWHVMGCTAKVQPPAAVTARRQRHMLRKHVSHFPELSSVS